MLMHTIPETKGSLMFKVNEKIDFRFIVKFLRQFYISWPKFDSAVKSCLDLILTQIIVKSRGCLMFIILRTKKFSFSYGFRSGLHQEDFCQSLVS